MTTKLDFAIQALLNEYGIKADYVEDRGSIKKVYSQHGTLAVKKTTLSPTELQQYERTLKFLHYKGYGMAVPVYRTTAGSYFVFDQQQSAYYVMPWLSANQEEERNDHAFKLFKQLGELHAKTSKDEQVSEEEIEKLVETEKDKWKKRKINLERYVEQCEEKTYMSPFELYFCTYYHELTRASDFASRKLDEWHEQMKEKKNYRTAFTHGKPSFQHYLYNVEGNGYLINFERAKRTPAIYDLLYFFYRSCKTFPFQNDDRFQWFQAYQKQYPLREDELTLFMAQLAYPESLYKAVQEYRKNKKGKSEREHVQHLQRAYWQMKNIEYFLTNVMMHEEKRKQQEAQEAQIT
ncbi:spore coat protein YsxE [Bacillus pinisoli]|uniref:spore coat protein YsxE n=1 Tax=Bacillus pinisoli TaxID=2901866 RepID=UPI001FF6E929|nr:spore coat protein YsxE [Bacillus pinisoli]